MPRVKDLRRLALGIWRGCGYVDAGFFVAWADGLQEAMQDLEQEVADEIEALAPDWEHQKPDPARLSDPHVQYTARLKTEARDLVPEFNPAVAAVRRDAFKRRKQLATD